MFFATKAEALAYIGNEAGKFWEVEEAAAFLIEYQSLPRFVETYRGLSSSEGVYYVNNEILRERITDILKEQSRKSRED